MRFSGAARVLGILLTGRDAAPCSPQQSEPKVCHCLRNACPACTPDHRTPCAAQPASFASAQKSRFLPCLLLRGLLTVPAPDRCPLSTRPALRLRALQILLLAHPPQG